MTALTGLSTIRSTPLRLTAVLLVIFALAATGSLAVAYLVTRANIDALIRVELQQTMDSFRVVTDQGELLERIAEVTATAQPRSRIIQYQPDRGARLSNVQSFPPVSGFSIIGKAGIDHPNDALSDSYTAISARVGDGQLIVAQSRDQIEEMGEVFLVAILIGLLPALLIAALAGAMMARTAKHRIAAIETALGSLTGGDLSARVDGISDLSDDLSGIGHAVNQMAAAQDTLDSSMRQMSSDIAHDLKTPIQRVAVLLDRLMNRTTLSAGQDVLLTHALEETDRIVRTFQALLQLAQIEGGAARDRLVPTDLAEVARDITDFLEVEAEDRGFALVCDAPLDSSCTVLGEKHLLSQLISNLIQNSLTHVPTGGPLRVHLLRDNDVVNLTVSDQGPGIPVDEHDKVLRRLYRLEHSRTAPGNGLGLSLVAAICHLHGAELTLQDDAPGLTVRVVFPAIHTS